MAPFGLRWPDWAPQDEWGPFGPEGELPLGTFVPITSEIPEVERPTSSPWLVIVAAGLLLYSKPRRR